MEKGPLQTEQTLEGSGQSYVVSRKALAPMSSVDDEGDSRDGECCCDDHGHRSGVTSLGQEASSDDAARFTWLAGSLGRGRRYGRIRFYRGLLGSLLLGEGIAELNRLDSLPILGVAEGRLKLTFSVVNDGNRDRIDALVVGHSLFGTLDLGNPEGVDTGCLERQLIE